MTRPTLYAFAGGMPAFLALAAAHHKRCLEDDELNHPFSHPDQNPKHTERLGAYWAEVMGGPAEFTGLDTSQTDVLRMHSGNGDMTELGRRFVVCFMQAADDAGLPNDPEFRQAIRSYMEWAIADVLTYDDPTVPIPDKAPLPSWSWDGLQSR